MSNVTISESIKYIGADDTTLDLFESQYIIPNGISYNSYVILDEKVAVMDTIDARKSEEWFNNLSNVLAGRNVDYIVISHLEPDHAANIKALSDKYPDAKLVLSAKAKAMLYSCRGTGIIIRNSQPEIHYGSYGSLARGYA